MGSFLDQVEESSGPRTAEHRGWKLNWTGWKLAFDNPIPAAQWVAYKKGGPYFYASCPGAGESTGIGWAFNLSDIESEGFNTRFMEAMAESLEATAHLLRTSKEETLARVKAVIDKHLEKEKGRS